MGGCCCCAFRETELSKSPAHYYDAPSAFSERLLIDTNLDTYKPPPVPLPFNVTLGATQIAPVAQEICCNKNNKSLLSKNLVEEEDTCPICLEEYDAENPKLTTQCGHDFHLACILEWMERSETCPVCDQVTVFSTAID